MGRACSTKGTKVPVKPGGGKARREEENSKT
jgi:hypothetical protein